MGDSGVNVQSLEREVVGSTPLPSNDPNEVSVLITGFGPFKTNLVNASYLIASSLPSSLAFPSKPSTTSEGVTHVPRQISLHVHPTPVPVAYSSVRTILPTILDDYAKDHGGRRPDIIIHMGIASTRRHYSVETQAHRDSYHISDVKGKSGYDDGEKLWRRLDLPPLLRPGLADGSSDTKKSQVQPYPPDSHFLGAWKSFCPPDTDVRLSHDAGRYLCEFIYYSSMAIALEAGEDRNAVFFHVPALYEAEDIELGKEVAIGLIKALVACWIDEKRDAAAV